MRTVCSILMLIARICISVIFLFAGFHKLMDYAGTIDYMATKHIPAVPYLFGAAFVEIIGGLSILLGYKIRLGAFLLILFLIPTTYLFHDFWNIHDPKTMQEQMTHFLSNIAILGGLLYVFCGGAGGCSIDKSCCHQTKPPEPGQ
jgi:putative oxidoreductase